MISCEKPVTEHWRKCGYNPVTNALFISPWTENGLSTPPCILHMMDTTGRMRWICSWENKEGETSNRLYRLGSCTGTFSSRDWGHLSVFHSSSLGCVVHSLSLPTSGRSVNSNRWPSRSKLASLTFIPTKLSQFLTSLKTHSTSRIL